MYGFESCYELLIKQMDWQAKNNSDDYERACWEQKTLRGPMIDADIDWRVPQDYRPMVAEDIGYVTDRNDA